MPRLNSQLFLREGIASCRRVHLIGATGAGMKGLAEILTDAGWLVSGSDSRPDQRTVKLLAERGMSISDVHAVSLVNRSTDLVIYSAAIPETNPERRQATTLGIPQISYHEALGQIVGGRVGLAIAGTHGKSSTTCLLAAIFEAANASPTFLCGAERISDHRNGKLGKGEQVILEACEYRRHFLSYRPQQICLLGIEEDHFDCYPRFEDACDAYQEFVDSLPPDGTLIYSADCKISQHIADQSSVRTISFSLQDRHADWFAENVNGVATVHRQGGQSTSYRYGLPGRHNLTNLVAALAAASSAGLDVAEIGVKKTIESPPKLKRRFELIESTPQRVVIDDYAHHPTEIRATLATVREEFSDRRVICCFQPHQLSRTKRLLDEFVEALALADVVYLLPVFAAREVETVEVLLTSERIVTSLQNCGCTASLIQSLDRVWRTLETDALRNDVILTLGAGDITRIHDERTRRI